MSCFVHRDIRLTRPGQGSTLVLQRPHSQKGMAAHRVVWGVLNVFTQLFAILVLDILI